MFRVVSQDFGFSFDSISRLISSSSSCAHFIKRVLVWVWLTNWPKLELSDFLVLQFGESANTGPKYKL
jgi:hypothetical protein